MYKKNFLYKFISYRKNLHGLEGLVRYTHLTQTLSISASDPHRHLQPQVIPFFFTSECISFGRGILHTCLTLTLSDKPAISDIVG